MKRLRGRAILLMWCVGLFAGCAVTARPVTLLYSPLAETRGGSGELFVRNGSESPVSGNASDVRWVIGKRKDSSGRVTGEILSTSTPRDMVLDALKRELTAAGYRVQSGPSMPSDVRKGLDLSSVQFEVEEISGISGNEVKGTVGLSIDAWRNGAKIKKLSYESKVSDFAILGRDRLPEDLIERGLRMVMSRAMPEIVATLERGSAN